MPKDGSHRALLSTTPAEMNMMRSTCMHSVCRQTPLGQQPTTLRGPVRWLRCAGGTAAMALLLAGCSSEMAMLPTVIAVEPSEGPFVTAAAQDHDPSATVVEIHLEAKPADVTIAPGHTVSMWTYNGQLPGPRIEANVGDTIRVHVTNSLPEATTIHWHGLRLPAAMDGVAATQPPIAPGGSFVYEFKALDAGTFWYHPHLRSDIQVERGLYGAIVVRGRNEPVTTSEQTVILDDMLVDASWQVADFDTMQAMVGRQGNLIIANGWAQPIAHVAHGGLHRYRFVNAANARFFRLALPGHKLIQIGSDGGLLQSPVSQDSILLVPGERADVLAAIDANSDVSAKWQSLPYDRGHGTGTLPAADIFLQQHDRPPAQTIPAVADQLASLPVLPEPTVHRELTLGESAGGGGHAGHGGSGGGTGPTFTINGQSHPNHAPLHATLGTTEHWKIANPTEMDHPFHLHGFRFQVTDINGVPPMFGAWRDTVNIPAHKSVSFRVQLEDFPGTWMFHCHILEHAERGMMGELVVAPAP